jgi:hypothetical protein
MIVSFVLYFFLSLALFKEREPVHDLYSILYFNLFLPFGG